MRIILFIFKKVDEIWSSFLRFELDSQNKYKLKDFSQEIQNKQNVQTTEMEDYFSKISKLEKKPRLSENQSDLSQKAISKNQANRSSNIKDNTQTNTNPMPKTAPLSTKGMEHSKSREKIIQQAFFSNINNSYGSLTGQKNSVPQRNISSSGVINTPNNEKNVLNQNSNSIGVSYNVTSVRSPKINNFALQGSQKIKVRRK